MRNPKVMKSSNSTRIPPQILRPGEPIVFSYSVYTMNDESTTWAHRMDHYWRIGNAKVHYIQIFVSIAIVSTCVVIIW